jgi:hypothetical protein
LINSARWFVKEGTFVKVSKGKAQTRHFYLFNDVLVYCRIHKVGVQEGRCGVVCSELASRSICLTLGLVLVCAGCAAWWCSRQDVKHNETRLHYAGRVMLKAALIRDLPDTSTRQNQIEVVRIDKKRRPYIIVMGTPSQKKDWFNRIIDLISIQVCARE